MQKNIHVLQTMNKFETIKDHCQKKNPEKLKTLRGSQRDIIEKLQGNTMDNTDLRTLKHVKPTL